MPVPAQCFNIVRGRVLRVTKLDECGSVASEAPDPPICEVIVTDGLISVAMTAEVEAGEEIRDRNWAGEICVTDRSPDTFIRWNLEFTFCNVDPLLISALTGAAVELDDDTAVGFRTSAGSVTDNVAVEMWTGTTPVVCAPGEDPTLGYTLLPFVQVGRMGDITIQNGRADFIVSGAFTKSGSGWDVGPYDVISVAGVPSPLEVAIQPLEHHLLRTTSIAAPEAACECLSIEEAGGTRPTS